MDIVFPVHVRRWMTKLRSAASRSAGRRSAAFRPNLEVLEDRWLLSALLVRTATDGGPGFLRQAICQARAGDTIDFDCHLAGRSITPSHGPLVLDKDLTITGLGADLLTSRGSACDPGRVLCIAASTTTVSASVNPSVFGQTVTFTAMVSPQAPGICTPSGEVIFEDGAALLGTAELQGGSASLSISTLATGSHCITAFYQGDSRFAASSSTAVPQVVGQAATTTTVTASSNPSTFGQPIRLTATVLVRAPGAGTPTGTVTFEDGATVLGSSTLDGNDQATLCVLRLAGGAHAITAVYGGDDNFSPSLSPLLNVQENPAATSTTVSASPASTVFGQPVTFTAVVRAVCTDGDIPTGLVTFAEGDTLLGTATLDASGHATFSTSSLEVGLHTITVTYNGNANFDASTAAADQTVTLAVQPLPSTPNGPSPPTVPPASPTSHVVPPATGVFSPPNTGIVSSPNTGVFSLPNLELATPVVPFAAGLGVNDVVILTTAAGNRLVMAVAAGPVTDAASSSSPAPAPLPEDSPPPTRFQSSTQLTPLLSPSPDSQLVPSQTAVEKRQSQPNADENSPGKGSPSKDGGSPTGPAIPKGSGQSLLPAATRNIMTVGSCPPLGADKAADHVQWTVVMLGAGLWVGEAVNDRGRQALAYSPSDPKTFGPAAR